MQIGVFFVQNDFVQCEANTSLLYSFTKQRELALCRLLNVSICHDVTAFVYLFIYLKMKLIATRVFGSFPWKNTRLKINCNISLKTITSFWIWMSSLTINHQVVMADRKLYAQVRTIAFLVKNLFYHWLDLKKGWIGYEESESSDGDTWC